MVVDLLITVRDDEAEYFERTHTPFLLTAEYEWGGGGQEEEALQQEAESMFLQKFTASSSAVDGDQAGGWCESFLRPLIPDCWE